MTENNLEEVNKAKLNYYFLNKIKVHIALVSREFIDGLIISSLQEDTFYWVLDNNKNKVRIFLKEVYKVSDYNREDLK